MLIYMGFGLYREYNGQTCRVTQILDLHYTHGFGLYQIQWLGGYQ